MTLILINGCVFFPHRFVWRQKPRVKRVWQTEVGMGVKGAEARQSLRAVARRSVSVEIFATDSERVRLESRIDAAKKSGFGCLPLIGRGSYLTVDAAAGANSVTVTTDAWHWQAGDYIALISNDQIFDVAAVTNVAAGVLTLATNLNFGWTSGFVIRPLLFGAFTADKQSVITGRVASWPITITELTSGRSAQIGVTPAHVPGIGEMQIQGAPIFEVAP